jgi:uncharacterized protein (TIGR03083 family)
MLILPKNNMKPIEPIFTAHLFASLDAKLIALLQSLSPADWQKQTIAPLWKVKDVAVHLLDGNIRGLSIARDGYFGEVPTNIQSYQDLVAFLNGLNADWVKAMRRVSPAMLVHLLETTGKEYSDYLQTLAPFEQAIFSVAWAGEESSANWFHIAREYTEKWHHQQQIRLAVGKAEELYAPELYFPHIDTSMRALPHHYRSMVGKQGDLINVGVENVGKWQLHHNGQAWELVTDSTTSPMSEVKIAGEVAWRIFTKGIAREEAQTYNSITGRQDAGEKILDMLAVMA